MQVICVRAHAAWKPGDQVEMPDGAGYSGLYFAAPDSLEARVALARKAEREAAEKAVAAAAQAKAAAAAGKPTSTPKASA